MYVYICIGCMLLQIVLTIQAIWWIILYTKNKELERKEIMWRARDENKLIKSIFVFVSVFLLYCRGIVTLRIEKILLKSDYQKMVLSVKKQNCVRMYENTCEWKLWCTENINAAYNIYVSNNFNEIISHNEYNSYSYNAWDERILRWPWLTVCTSTLFESKKKYIKKVQVMLGVFDCNP